MHLRHHFDTTEIIASLRDLAQSRGENITLHEFCSHLGISQSTLLRRCGRWQNLRTAAGLKRPRAPLHTEFSDSQLIDEYRRIATFLGRPPRESEFNRLSPARYSTLIRRFGDSDALHRRARIRDEYEETFGKQDLTDDRPQIAWDESWLRKLWPRIRVRYALRSSDLREQFNRSRGEGAGEAHGRTAVGVDTPCDVIFCAVHDWPTSPVPVLVAARVLGERARQPPVSQP
jgi:hypothetical protein